jgi:hypothetical protein
LSTLCETYTTANGSISGIKCAIFYGGTRRGGLLERTSSTIHPRTLYDEKEAHKGFFFIVQSLEMG